MRLDIKIILLAGLCLFLMDCSLFDTEDPEPYVTYRVTLGGNGYSAAQDVIEINDAYVLAGTIGPQCDIVDGYMTQVDKRTGVSLKTRTFGRTDQGFEENFFSMIQTSSGGFKAVGFALEKEAPTSPEDLFCLNRSGDGRAFLASIDESFTESSSRYFQKDSLWESSFEIKETPAGELLIAGSWNIKTAVMQIKADTIFDIIQSDNFFGNGFKMLMHSSGRIFITAESYNNSNVYWAEVDLAGGRFINERLYSFETQGDWQTSLAYAIVEANDGNLLLAGTMQNSQGKDGMFIMKLDLGGNQMMFKHIPLGTNDAIFDMIPFEDEYIITGKVTVPDVTIGSDALIAKIDEEGNILWSEFHDFNNNNEWSNAVIATQDGGFLLAGRTVNFDNGIQTILLVKTDGEGKVE